MRAHRYISTCISLARVPKSAASKVTAAIPPSMELRLMHLSATELEALRLSLNVAARSVLFSLPCAVLVAWLLTRGRFAGRWLLDALVHLPLVLPPVAVGYVLLLLFGNRGP